MRKTEDGWQVNPLFIDRVRDFTYWTDASTLCEWMAGYARGPRKTLVEAQGADCMLTHWPPERGQTTHPRWSRVQADSTWKKVDPEMCLG